MRSWRWEDIIGNICDSFLFLFLFLFKQRVQGAEPILSSNILGLLSCLLVTQDRHTQFPCLLPEGMGASQALPCLPQEAWLPAPLLKSSPKAGRSLGSAASANPQAASSAVWAGGVRAWQVPTSLLPARGPSSAITSESEPWRSQAQEGREIAPLAMSLYPPPLNVTAMKHCYNNTGWATDLGGGIQEDGSGQGENSGPCQPL